MINLDSNNNDNGNYDNNNKDNGNYDNTDYSLATV